MGDQSNDPDLSTELMVEHMTLNPSKPTTQSSSAQKTRSSWKKDYALPPCKVCGGDGSGVHYGINTCEACKGFFRRSLARKETYKCRQNQKCRLEAGKRNMCSSCRLKRCLDVGMSTEGIKIGRYTTEKRRQDTVQVKQLQAVSALASRMQSEWQRDRSREGLVESIVEGARRHFHSMEAMHDNMSALSKQIQQKSQTEENLLNTLEMMSHDEFNQYLQGIEPEPNEQTVLFGKCVQFLEDMIRKYIKFAKAVPGFKDLKMDDQIALVKASYNDVTMIYKYRFCQGESAIHQDDRLEAKLCDGMPEDYKKLVLQMAAKFRSLELTEEEMQLVNALLLVSPDRCDLVEPDKATEIQDAIVDSLQWLLRKNHDHPQMVFARLVSVLTEMRTFGEVSRELTRTCIGKHVQKNTQIPPLLIEIMT